MKENEGILVHVYIASMVSSVDIDTVMSYMVDDRVLRNTVNANVVIGTAQLVDTSRQYTARRPEGPASNASPRPSPEQTINGINESKIIELIEIVCILVDMRIPFPLLGSHATEPNEGAVAPACYQLLHDWLETGV